ncbi:hypothetical protein M8C21_026679 [Ambrosia artemisiifolia]|uniref:Uncharacterized protein n=1 Tax=Ambrosia artemisiifolia TaxID=4212 RepID=A0AAD5D6Q9_AMBAR|nr:hypothetical protein M8C21_026679 [Ambrosia artemisiifolia]
MKMNCEALSLTAVKLFFFVPVCLFFY